jgi:hypothetical protein
MNRVHRAPVRHGRPVRIACVNKAKLGLGVPFGKLTAALQKCYDRHFLPVWGFPVKLYNTRKPKATDWQFVYFDNPDAAGVLGYHDLTINGRPLSKVFVGPTLEMGEKVSVTASHELFEMVIDPIANMWAQATRGREFAYEMSDPVEEDTFPVDGIEMSNFVYPTWFEPFRHPRGTKYDHLGLLKAPFTMTKGGYVIVKQRGKVKERYGSKAKARRFAAENRRGHRAEHRKTEGRLIARKRRRMVKRPRKRRRSLSPRSSGRAS